MKIIIVGAGKIGELLCKDLSSEGNDVIIIEQDSRVLDKIITSLDVMGVLGNGATLAIQREAGVMDTDVFIAVTEFDEINILASIMAKRLGARYTIARVRNPEYALDMEFMTSSLGIDMIINPDVQAARFIARNIFFPNALNVESFSEDRVSLVEMVIDRESPLCNLKISDLHRFSNAKILICTLERKGEVFIPNGEFRLQSEDKIYVTGTQEEITNFYIALKHEVFKINSVFIVGGGRTTYYLMDILLKRKLKVKVIELDETRADYLSENFEKAVVIHGNGVDTDLLEEEEFKNFDAFVSLTGIDEENMILSMYAKKLGIKKTVTKISSTNILNFLKLAELQSIVSPKQIVSNTIVKFVRCHINPRGNDILVLYRILNNEVEAIEFKVGEKSKILNIPLKDLKLRKNIIISCITRGKEIIFPSGKDEIRCGDRVIVITTNKYLDNIDDILE